MVIQFYREHVRLSGTKHSKRVVRLPRSGRPSTSLTDTNIDAVKEFISENHHGSLREIAQVLNISHESVRTILIDRLADETWMYE
ncbi:uncharacterized protein Dana_GF26736, isoform A [Drosophila ananassae]|uniref:Uncharacterized protein, isoform A n=1 Tax=Drosophila ananassae TaxID=7217 RepID=A0A0P8XKC5_DROAN|nr:uncharacterized protein Dana_GF26736, isoform A [Drosophila ananassae]